jgi:hypothetical protein
MESFFKITPAEVVESHNSQDGITILKNGSTIFWLHLDNVDENTLRGLEVNSVIIDQAEEVEDKVYRVLLSRIGRWDYTLIPQDFLDKFPEWPRNTLTSRPIAPSYFMGLCNPSDQFHWTYLDYHPESIDRQKDAFFVHAEWNKQLGSIEAYEDALKNDAEFVEKYVKGNLVRSLGSIHTVPLSAILEPTKKLLERIRERGNLFRVLDHGDSAPTCCLWFAALDGVYICYREYYVPGKVISYHRKSIVELSEREEYSGNYADPSIFRKQSQRDGGFWTVGDEYRTSDIKEDPLFWTPADNNEFATRNRLNELLTESNSYCHPINQVRPAVGLYFVKATSDYPQGCREAIRQLGAQRRQVLGSVNGKTLWSDERDKSIVDHAYDCVRYFVAMHGTQPSKVKKAPPPRSFAYFNQLTDYLSKQRDYFAASRG